MKETLSKKYAKELKIFSKASNLEQQWLLLLQDLTNDSESVWDYNSIRYDTVMTKKEWEDFSTHKERIPYKSKIINAEGFEERFDYIIKVIVDSYKYYKSLKKDTEFKQKLKVSIGSLLKCAVNARYDTEVMRFADVYVGRTDEERDDGKVDPTPESLSRLNYAIKEYAYLEHKDYEKLKKKIFDLCNGRIAVLSEYYTECDIDDDLRKEIKGITEIYGGRNLTLVFFDIKLGWEIWKMYKEVGLDVDSFLELIDLPKYKVIEKKLMDFYTNKEFVEEVLKHMEDELPKTYAKYKKYGSVNNYDLLVEETRRKKYPKRLRSQEEVEKMIKECQDEIFSYFPLAKNESPRNILLNPTHPQSTGRAFNSNVKNINEIGVNTIVMTPRVLKKDEYLPVLAHEVTHGLHRYILELGEKSGVLEKGAADRVPTSVLEDFSQLVEHVFYKDKDLPYKKKFKGKEFPNFRSSIGIRMQVPYALVQLGVRKDFDDLWNNGYREILTEKMVWDLKEKFDKKVRNIMSLGINIVYDNLSAFRFFAPYNPDDGLVYMKRYITQASTKLNSKKITKSQILEGYVSKNSEISMSDALKEKFGRNWIESKDAKTVLLWLLLETGRNYKTEKFGDYILKSDYSAYITELKKIGVHQNH